MEVITAAVIKGGTGKTTTAAALAQAAVYAGKRVLAVDLDPQGNYSFTLGADPNRPGAYQLLHGAGAADLIQHTEQGVDIITASPDLSTERTTPASAKRLVQALEPVSGLYDYCIIDTPPQIGELTFNALEATDRLIIPLETDNNSLQGLYQIADIAHQMQKSNKRLQIAGLILTRYDNRPKINRFLRDTIEEAGQEVGVPFLMAIRSGVAIREAQAMQQSLYSYAPRSKPAQDYKKLFEMLTKLNK